MKLRVNVIVQVLGFILQAYNQYGGMIPEKWKPVVMGIVGIIQGVVAIMSHFSNPDGTNATTPYVAPK
jgi:hypothetical protein